MEPLKSTTINLEYDVFSEIYKDLIGESLTIDSIVEVIFNLSEGVYMNLIKELSPFKLPQIRSYQLDYVPDDSDEIRDFMTNSITKHSEFYFNLYNNRRVDGGKYLSSLKAVAEKTEETFSIRETDFSQKDFCELLAAAQGAKNLYIRCSIIPLDSEVDLEQEFNSVMGNCKIEFLDLNNTGGSSYSNWEENPQRFENLISGITRCPSLVQSLKTLSIASCGLTREVAQKTLDKYELTDLKLEGV